MEYQGFCTAEIGTNGTGKTFKAIQCIQNNTFRIATEKDLKYYSILVLVSDDQEEQLKKISTLSLNETKNFTGWGKLVVDDNIDEVFSYLNKNFSGINHNGKIYPSCIFVDDAGAIFDTRNLEVMKFFKKRRQNQCDIILNFHGASEYPRSLFKNTTDFLIFQTTDSLKEIEARMSSDLVERFRLCCQYVNLIASYGNSFPSESPQKIFSYFSYRFNQKNPPTAEKIRELIRSLWWTK